jgi:hypothetical protein
VFWVYFASTSDGGDVSKFQLPSTLSSFLDTSLYFSIPSGLGGTSSHTIIFPNPAQ